MVTMLLFIVKSLSRVRLFVTPRTGARQTSLSITNSRSLLKLGSTESVMPSNHLVLCCPLLFTSIFPNIRIFSNESALRSRWPKYWGFTFSISPSNEYSGLIFFRINWFYLLSVQGTLKSLLQQHNSKSSIQWLPWGYLIYSWKSSMSKRGDSGKYSKTAIMVCLDTLSNRITDCFCHIFFTLSHIFASWKTIIIRYCFHHEDKKQLMIHLTVHDLSFPVVNCHSFCGHSTKPLHARTLKSIR